MSAPIKIDSAFIATELDDEIVLVGVDSGEFLSLDGSAKAIWALIDGSRDASQITQLMKEHYFDDSVDAGGEGGDTIKTQVRSFLAELRQAGLIQWAGD